MTDKEFEEKFLIHRQLATKFFKVNYKLTQEEIEDIIQIAYLKIYKRFKGQDITCEHPKKYLFDSVKNCIYEFRTRKKYVQNEYTCTQINMDFESTLVDIIIGIDFDNIPENILEDKMIADELRFLIDKLSEKNPEMSESLRMFYFDEMQSNEISDQLNVPINTIKTRLHRGRNRIKSMLQKDMILSTL